MGHEMTAGELESMAERLMLGEYTTADLHAAARCARGWAKVEKLLVDHPGSSITLVLGNKSMICLNVHNGTTGETALECIEAVEATEAQP